MRRTSSTSRGERGLTLIEIAVAIAILGIMLAVAVPAFRAATDADLKSDTLKIGAAHRTCFGEAAVKNATLRVAYDLDRQAFWVEGFPGTFQVVGGERDLDRARREESEREEKEKRDRELQERYGSANDPQATGPAPKFVPVAVAFLEPQRMTRGVRITGVRTPQFRQVVKDGRAYTHFFPNGWAEHTLIYVEDRGGSKLTLETEPLTGHVVVWDGELDYRDVEEQRKKGEG